MNYFWGKSYIASRRKTAWPALCAFAAACMLISNHAYAAVYSATWNFDTSGNINASTTTGSGYSTPTLATGGGNGLSVTQPVNTGTDLYMQYASTSAGGLNSSYFTVTLTAVGNHNNVAFDITYSVLRGSNSGGSPNVNTWSYSINGATFVSITPTESLANSGTTYNFTPSTPVVNVSNGQTIVFKDTLSGGGGAGTTGTEDFNNLVVSAVPEPINYALAVFGLVFVGGSIGRHYLASKSVSPVA